LTTPEIHAEMEQCHAALFEPGQVRWQHTGQVMGEQANQWKEQDFSDAQLAYLQYTSGSTSYPKGVMISHRNLTYHLGHLQKSNGYGPDSVTVTWMPYYHDYGLVEGLLEPLFNVTPCYLISPLAFIKRPYHWLKAISLYRGTHSQAPN